MSLDLKPCPFCGGKDLSIYIKGMGGRKQGKERATEEWNRRSENA